MSKIIYSGILRNIPKILEDNNRSLARFQNLTYPVFHCCLHIAYYTNQRNLKSSLLFLLLYSFLSKIWLLVKNYSSLCFTLVRWWLILLALHFQFTINSTQGMSQFGRLRAVFLPDQLGLLISNTWGAFLMSKFKGWIL